MDKYREGKVKSTADSGVKENLKPCARKRSEPLRGVTACLLHNEPTSCSSAARVRTSKSGPGAKASPKRAFQSPAADAKLCDLPPARLKAP